MVESRRPRGHAAGDSPVRRRRDRLAVFAIAAVLAAFLLPACGGRRGGAAPEDSALSSSLDDPLFAEARSLEDAGRFREAIEAYDGIRRDNRDGAIRGRATYRIGLAYLGLGNARLARDEFARVADSTDDPAILAPALLELGGLRMREGTWLMAESALRRALELGLGGSDAARAHYQLAVVCQKDGRDAEAREHYALAGTWRPAAGDGYAYAEPAAERDAAAAGARAPKPATSPVAKRPKLGFDVIARSAWNATASRANSDPMGRVTRITVHHSGLRDDATDYGGCATMVKKMQRQHVEDRGWADIGYHFIIDRAGRVWEGRPIELQGAHAGNGDANAGNVGVALSGDFDNQQPTAKQKQVLRAVIESLMATYRVPAMRLATHREVKRAFRLPMTECPGKNLQAFVDSLRKEFAAAERAAAAPAKPLAKEEHRSAPAGR